jgi:type I restriction enzyme S subunit
VKWTRRVTPEANDLLFSYETRIGEAALMPDGVQACLGRRMALLRPNRSSVDPRFLLYFYLSPGFQRTIAKHTIHGATVSRIGLATMPDWEIEIPDLEEQHAVGAVLGALDDKIAANERAVHVAEALMLAAVESVPESTRLSELAGQLTSSRKPEDFADCVAHFSLPAFDGGAVPEIVNGRTVKSNKFELSEPCVLFAKLNPRIPRIWNVCRLPEEMSLASTEFVVLAPIDVDTSVLWATLCQPSISEELRQKVAGTSGSHQRIRPQELLGVQVRDVRKLDGNLASLVADLGQVCYESRKESRDLARTRDELLPLLMSGKAWVKDAEAAVSGAL